MHGGFADVDDADLKALTRNSYHDGKDTPSSQDRLKVRRRVPAAMEHDHDDCRQCARQRPEQLHDVIKALSA
jgi:hypothetical protein